MQGGGIIQANYPSARKGVRMLWLSMLLAKHGRICVWALAALVACAVVPIIKNAHHLQFPIFPCAQAILIAAGDVLWITSLIARAGKVGDGQVARLGHTARRLMIVVRAMTIVLALVPGDFTTASVAVCVAAVFGSLSSAVLWLASVIVQFRLLSRAKAILAE